MLPIIGTNDHEVGPHCPVCSSKSLFYKLLQELYLYKCQGCGSYFYHPLPHFEYEAVSAPHSLKWYVTRDANLMFFADLLTAAYRAVIVQFPQKKREDVALLEVGCAYGFLLDMANIIYGWRTVGLEPGEYGLEGASQLGVCIHPTYAEHYKGVKKFDIVITSEVIEHTTDPTKFLAAISEHLTEDGLLLVETPNARCDTLRNAEFGPGQHTVIFSKEGLGLALSRVGFVHQHFFQPLFRERLAVVACRRPLSDMLGASLSADGFDNSRATLRGYLENRTERDQSLDAITRQGFCYRLVELLVDQGAYLQAEAVMDNLDDLMAAEGVSRSSEEIMASYVSRMTEEQTFHNYCLAGPCFMAPYAYSKAMFNLNHKADYGKARLFFEYSSRLYEHEVTKLGLDHFKERVELSTFHRKLANQYDAANKVLGAAFLPAPNFLARIVSRLRKSRLAQITKPLTKAILRRLS